MNKNLFFLILLTVFAFLFLIVFYNNIKLTKDIENTKMIIKAYELYANNDDKGFVNFVKENNLKELESLAQRLVINKVRNTLDRAISSFRVGNYGESSTLLMEIKDIENPWMDEVYYYIGLSLLKIGEDARAKLYLSSFLESFRYSIYRKEALLILKEITKDKQILERIDKELKGVNKWI